MEFEKLNQKGEREKKSRDEKLKEIAIELKISESVENSLEDDIESFIDSNDLDSLIRFLEEGSAGIVDAKKVTERIYEDLDEFKRSNKALSKREQEKLEEEIEKIDILDGKILFLTKEGDFEDEGDIDINT
tara:strand:+ start:562 stop:954 length:393 start_codon:yes stop_codon:yes gene_type:complete